ncbi:NUDIX hydrolase [Paludisphaera soli]|uniref:NUDIX hydrolase n=1 Tax=Paludisphaera soli TaxID=2712865 RepID=UPI0013ED0673|nr:NUDIX hydrolase [Paludisphaera soli]
MTSTLVFALLFTTAGTSLAEEPPTLPEGYWPEAKAAEILAKTQEIRLAPDLAGLDENEQAALASLLQAGAVFQRLYEDARHHQALKSHQELIDLDRKLGSPKRTKDLLDLYRLFQGPIATTLANAREPFLPVGPQLPGRNVYPIDATGEQVTGFVDAHPDRKETILAERSVVRRSTRENLDRDLKALEDGALDILHPGLKAHLQTLAKAPDEATFYAVPYAVAYAHDLRLAFGHLNAAADRLQATDEDLAAYLRNRARDLLSNDYESGDASWVSGRFRKLNAQIGAYETYDDALFGVKAFSSFSLLLIDRAATDELRKKLGGLQKVEDALPYDHAKRVREDISVGVYDVIADFGQARGTNTATILPNDATYSRKYGRTILLRRNVMENPELFATDLRIWKAATADRFADDLAPAGNFQRTLWHEVGHYLGVDRDKQGRTLDAALRDQADAMEEMKADLVSLFTLHRMAKDDAIDAKLLRAVQAGGIRRTLQNVKPRKDQPYQTMQLAQFNYFLDRGLIAADPETARLTIDYAKYAEVVTDLLHEVLGVQYEGDRDSAEAFLTKWGAWTPELHERLAARIRDAQGARFRIVRYGALGE